MSLPMIRFTLAAALLLAASCVSPVHEPPLEGEPTAWIKTEYAWYKGVPEGPTAAHVSLLIREGKAEKFRLAYNQSWGSVTTRIRPVEDTVIRMRLGFKWTTREWVSRTPVLPTDSEGFPQTTIWHLVPVEQESGCSATQQFNPEPDQIYLAYYSGPYVDTDCIVAIFLETPNGDGTFKLEPVGEPYVE
jgi:hypothetical protein